jgi:methylmalonyl-CoA mutase, N-terminal domain
VIAHETDLTATVDPFAGSYAVEAMTDEVEAEVTALMARVEELGGAVRAIDQGFQKQEIERSAYQVAREIEDGRRVVVGVNRFAVEGDEKYQPLRMDPSIEAEQRTRLAALRAARSAADVRRGLDAVRAAAAGRDNVLYPLRDALRARATVGEVCNALREVWGTYRPPDLF